MVQRRIVAFNRDDGGDWIAELECGHARHVRHDPPWQDRGWVTTAQGRRGMLGMPLECRRCDEAVQGERR